MWNDEDVGMLEGRKDVEDAINNMNFDKCLKLVKMIDNFLNDATKVINLEGDLMYYIMLFLEQCFLSR